MHSANPGQALPTPVRAPALGIHTDAVRRLIRRRETLPPQDNLTFASIFYRNWVFTQVVVGDSVSHSRWRIYRGDLVPFRPSPEELQDIARHLYTSRKLSDVEISAALAIDLRQTQGLLSGLANYTKS